MLVLIGILIIILIIVVIFYQNLIAEKVKVEDANAILTQHLKEDYNIDKENIAAQMEEWSKNGMQLNPKTVKIFEYIGQVREDFEEKVKQFPYSVMAELFKIKI